MLEMLKQHLAEFEAGDWDAFKAQLASDADYFEAATNVHVHGAEEYVAVLQRWRRAFPDTTATIVNGFEAGDNAVAELVWEGTHTGPFEGPFGTIPPSGARGRLQAMLLVRRSGGKITSVRHYFDLLSLLSQLGIAPMASVGAQPGAQAAEPAPTRH